MTIRKPAQDVSTASEDLEELTLSESSEALTSPEAQLVHSLASTQELGEGDELLEITSPVPAVTSQGSGKSLTFKSAFEEARHFAGGLVSHPYEATKHYAILRHSHGLVYFKGFNTNVAITIFGDRPLPDDRQFWLQKRGYSGRTGLKIGASILGTKGAWINVTPTTRCNAENLPPSDERAWQRDIEKFVKKAAKGVKNHKPLETCILRIPCNAEDGYFRVILCTGEKGKKTLCPSPVFRLVSTSASMGSLRGASLSTMPLELGIKIGQFAARRVALNAAAPVADRAAKQAKNLTPWQPSGFVQNQAVSQAQSSAQTQLDEIQSQWEEAERAQIDQYIAHMQANIDEAQAIGPEHGPEEPFPIHFTGKVVPGTGRSRTDLGMPTANLASVPDDIAIRLSGTYFGWAMFTSHKGLDLEQSVANGWHQMVLTALPRSDGKASVVMQKAISTYLLLENSDARFVGAKLSLLIMGRIRPMAAQHHLDEVKNVEQEMATLLNDIAITEASLGRPNWGPDITLERAKTNESNRSIKDRLVDARGSVQKGVDKVPVHWAGVRTDRIALRDRLVGNGGVWVVR